MAGRKASPETRAKLSAAHKGKPKPPGFGEKISKARIGIKCSPEACRNIGLAAKGRKRSPESQARINEANSKWYIVINPEGVETKIKNLHKFCRENNLEPCTMIGVANGRRKQHKGWKCRNTSQ